MNAHTHAYVPTHVLARSIPPPPSHHTGGDRVNIAIATYDSSLHFYNLTTGHASPQMLVVPDVKDVYAPLAANLVAPLEQCRGLVTQLLEQIPSMFASNNVTDTAGGAAVQAAVNVLKVCVGFVCGEGVLGLCVVRVCWVCV